MTDTMVHRGPDDAGYFIEDGVGMGMRRLSIIDVAGGRQPIASEDGSVVVVCNGEIYNYLDLCSHLSARGHILRTRCDVESIVHLYEEHGVDFSPHLRGMFSIALYDRVRRRLVLARDRLGKKPMYYAKSSGRLLFGSEIKPILLAAPELRRVNWRAIQPYFRFGFVPEPETIYEGIYALPAGCTLEFEGGTSRIRQYWDLSFARALKMDGARRSAVDYADELDTLLEEAVRIRLMSEVPLGVFLSGGPDSSLLVAYMSCLMNQPVRTFTIGFDEATFDESSEARRVAKHFQTEHHVESLRLEDIRQEFFTTVEDIVGHVDQPFGDSSALPTYHVARLAREDVTVILSGDGADEVFGGYTMYQGLRFAHLYRNIPDWLSRFGFAPSVHRWAALSRPGPSRWRANTWKKRLADSRLPFCEMLVSKFSITTPPLLDRLVPGARNVLNLDEIEGKHWIVYGDATEPFEQTLYAGTRFFQVNDMLVKVDRMSMAHSLEVRSPYLDHKVVEFAASIPSYLKLRGWETKAILRDVAARYLPMQNARKRKHGFGVPVSLWFRDSMWPELRERLTGSRAVDTYLERRTVREVLEQHRSGAIDYGQLIWCLVVFDAWHRAYVEERA